MCGIFASTCARVAYAQQAYPAKPTWLPISTYVRGSGDGEGTVALKRRAWFAYVAPILPDKNEKD